MINKVIEINNEIALDNIRHSLQNHLTTKQLIDFAISLGDDLTEEIGYYKNLNNKLAKLINKIDKE